MTQFEELMQEELKLESSYRQDGYEAMMSAIHKARASEEVATNLSAGQGLFHWKAYELNKTIKEWLDTSLTPKAGCKPTYYPLLQDLARAYSSYAKADTESISVMLSSITLSTIINQLCAYTSEQHPLNNIAYAIAIAVENEYRAKAFQNWLDIQDDNKIKNALKGIDKRVGKDYRKEYLTKAIKNCGYPDPRWIKQKQKEMRALGVQLILMTEAVTGYFVVRSAPYIQDYIMATPQFNEAWRRNEDNMLCAAHKLCPMVVPPAPWTTFNDGGYYGALAEFNNLLRLKEIESIFGETYMKIITTLDMPNVYKAVNALQATPWKINKQVLSVLQTCRELGYIPNGKEKSSGYIINLRSDDYPAKPSENADEETIKAYKSAMVSWLKQERRRSSLENRANSIINTADKFKDYDNIYFPANMDFRGRIYFIPLMSPQGDDLCKGLLLFSNVPPFQSEEDLNYLAITGANLAGVDKVSYEDRIKWVHDNEEHILASAEDPIGYHWWLSVDSSPVELLAFCFEWKKAKDYMSEHNGSIVGFETGLPYAQDGTCSGLQHFSAMLRDEVGGTAVNLVPQDKPNDVYQQVADKVNVVLEYDAIHGTPDEWKDDKLVLGTRTKAQLWLNYAEKAFGIRKIKRSTCKRPTMTLAYGAKKFGFKEMILEDTIRPAIEREMRGDCPFTTANSNQCALYMAGLIWDAVGKTVVKAVEGMAWLQQVASIVTKDANGKGAKVVSWSTPMGLLLQQNYSKHEMEMVKLKCMGKRFRIYCPRQNGAVDARRQCQAIAPNFVHSMDACHLQYTLCESVDAGIHHFAMIHDSYGCPMSQAGLMYKIVRECFVKMYQDNDVLMQFKNDLQELTDEILPDPPSKGNFDLEQVNNSKYIFC